MITATGLRASEFSRNLNGEHNGYYGYGGYTKLHPTTNPHEMRVPVFPKRFRLRLERRGLQNDCGSGQSKYGTT